MWWFMKWYKFLIFLIPSIALAQPSPGNQVKVINGSGAAAVNIQDGGNSITVDGTVAATQSGAWTNACTQSGTWNIGTVTSVTGPVPASQSGTWTVQPGNTANTTAWKVDGSAVTQPISVTEANQPFTAPKVNNAGDTGMVTIPKQARWVTNDTAETGSTSSVINATSHSARPGDILEFISGTAANIGVEFEVASTTTNTITVKGTLPSAPANGNAFIIQRPATAALTTASTSHGHAQYCAIDAIYGATSATTPYHAGADSSSSNDVGMGLALQGRRSSDAYVGSADRDQYIPAQADQDGLLAVTIDGQVANTDLRGSTCAESGGGTTTLVTSNSKHLYIRKISCRNSNTASGTQLKFSFLGGGGGGTEIWNGGISNLDNSGLSGGSGGYDSGVFFPPLRGELDDDFYFEPVDGIPITCCALWYRSDN